MDLSRQSQPGDQLASTLEQALARQIVLNERLRLRIIAGLLGALIAPLLAGLVLFPDCLYALCHGSLPPTPLLVLLGAALAYALIAHAHIGHTLRTNQRPPALPQYVNVLVETSLPTLLIVIAAGAVNPVSALVLPPSLVYLLVILLGTLRLDFWLSVFGGAVAAAQYLALAALYLGEAHGLGLDPVLTAPLPHVFKGSLFLVGGVLAGVVGLQIKQQVLAAFRAVEERDRVINMFGQHVSPAVVEKLLAQDVELGGEIRHVCLMFLDIRDFTAFAERREPGDVVQYLNGLFEFMIDSINRHGGIVNKFLGDGFMAVFGAPISDGRDSQRAVAAAREILARLSELNAAGQIPPTRIGIGLHAGEAVTGNVGSALRKEYTIIGHTVNLAARIEELNKRFGSQLLVSEAVWQAIGGGGQDGALLGPVHVRGKAAAIYIYQLV